MILPSPKGALIVWLLGTQLYSGSTLAGPDGAIGPLEVTSADLAQGFADRYVLNVYGCSGGNLSPSLQWRGAPEGTKSFVVTLYDPDDADSPSGWWHWVVFDIPDSVSGLSMGAGVARSRGLPKGARQGRTDLGVLAYHGPCPDKGDKPHRYTFTVYALDVAALPIPAGSSGAMVVETAHDHIIAKGTLVVPYGR
jgi:Raf kinase inhibitor-like YbhB/YbcL family protein